MAPLERSKAAVCTPQAKAAHGVGCGPKAKHISWHHSCLLLKGTHERANLLPSRFNIGAKFRNACFHREANHAAL